MRKDNITIISAGFYSASPDDSTFRYLAHTYADNHGRMARGVACEPSDNFPGGVTNGAQWYDVPGGMQVSTRYESQRRVKISIS